MEPITPSTEEESPVTRKPQANERRFVTITFDITDMSEAEADALVGEVTVQGEASDDHPDAPLVSQTFTFNYSA
jgi:hypothetical protein